jgi:hypothetical protein
MKVHLQRKIILIILAGETLIRGIGLVVYDGLEKYYCGTKKNIAILQKKLLTHS